MPVACYSCRRSHTKCDGNRPCKRCTARGTPLLCLDEEAIANVWPAPQQPRRKRVRRRSATHSDDVITLARTLRDDCLNMACHLEQFLSAQLDEFTS